MCRVTLWDLRRSLTGVHGVGNSVGAPPQRLSEVFPHRKGIFAMHEVGGRVVTASKDGDAAVCALSATGLVHTRSFRLGMGCLKTARWRDEHIFACAGDQGDIALVDTRAPAGAAVSGGASGETSGAVGSSLRMSQAHPLGITDVRWSPAASHLLLSSGRGTSLLLHDVRAPREPVLVLRGHARRDVRGLAIYTPTFCHGGRGVSACGEASARLSLYDVEGGARVWEASLGAALGDDGKCRPLEAGAHLRAVPLGGGAVAAEEALVVTVGRRVEAYVAAP